MTTTRRSFITAVATVVAGLAIPNGTRGVPFLQRPAFPVVISTRRQGLQLNEEAWRILKSGGYALDAVEAGIRFAEADPDFTFVGKGSFPDSKGKVTLDACIMNERSEAGSVTFLQSIKHPVSVARRVMEQTPHVMLSGKGALEFALQNGFSKEKLITKEMRNNWRRWKKEQSESVKGLHDHLSVENDDSIGMIAIDKHGRLCGACSSSGAAYKTHGRVGASPIVGAGLYIDGETGGALATGNDELVLKNQGSFLVVEFMRRGMTPDDACTTAVARIAKKAEDFEHHQIGFIALSAEGVVGAASIQSGFEYAVKSLNETRLVEAESWFKRL